VFQLFVRNDMKKLTLLFSAILLLSFTFYLENPLDEIKRALDSYVGKNPQEKIFVHTDRPYYSAGDTIWYKVYLTAGLQNVPSALSKVAYLQLLNDSGVMLKENTLKMIEGTAHGYIALPDSLQSGGYVLRSFSKWMLNFDNRLVSMVPLRILSTSISDDEKGYNQTLERESNYGIQFFPEGGDLINGLHSKIGVKAVDKDGRGLALSGKIQSDKGDLITTFECNSLGMGFFVMTPKAGNRYQAIVDSNNQTIQLPIAKDAGASMSVTNKVEGSDIIIKIQSTSPSGFYVVVDTRGLLCFGTKVSVQSGFAFVKVPKSNILPGIAHVTLFNEKLLPIAERLIFIEDNSTQLLEVTTDKNVYKPREKTKINISLGSDPEDIEAALSATFFDSKTIYYDQHNLDIRSYLLLTSDLAGFIESPGFYFDSTNSKRHEALEALMLTQGWIRFRWDQIRQPEWPTINHLPEQSLTLQGRLIDRFTGKPLEEGKLTLLEGKNVTDGMVYTKSDRDGFFSLADMNIYDTSSLRILSENKRGNKEVARVQLLRDSMKIDVKLLNDKTPLKDFERAFVEKSVRNRDIDKTYKYTSTIMLEGVEIKGTKIEKQAQVKTYGKGTNSVQASTIAGSQTFTSPLQLLQGRVPGVQVLGNGPSTTVQIRGPGSVTASNAPLILFDDVPTTVGAINSIPVLSIESVEVFKGADATIFGAQGANGVIAFYSKRGSEVTPETAGSMELSNWGYHVYRQRYEPVYDVKRPEHIKPDERITIHWQPDLKTSSDRQTEFSFYNADVETTVIGIIQGITKKGRPIVKQISYRVEQ
jgi:hypothetical protein